MGSWSEIVYRETWTGSEQFSWEGLPRGVTSVHRFLKDGLHLGFDHMKDFQGM